MSITEREKNLWKILDDIDTATDMFKPDNNQLFTQYVYKAVKKRFRYLKSDGYNLKEIVNGVR